jgi:hypothetical protein
MFLRDAEVAFLEEVAHATDMNGNAPMDFKVDPGLSAPMLSFQGYDRSDLEVSGWLALTMHDYDVKVHMEMTHAQYGRKQDVMKLKTGEVTPALVAKRVLDFIFGPL